VIHLRCGEERFEVHLREGAGGVEVAVRGQVFRFSVAEAGAGAFAVTNGRRGDTLHLVREGNAVHLFWRGAAYALTEERESSRAAHRHDPGTLEAPMPGRVVAVRVVPGQRVSKGEDMLVVEAMKMENALRAPRAGIVRAIHVAAGDMVAPGRPLVEIEAGAGPQ